MPMSDNTVSDLYSDSRLAAFYDAHQPRRTDFEYCRNLARSAGSVLDLGCGTGVLATALSNERTVVGVDPAAAMLEIARARDTRNAVRWVEGDAVSVRLGRRFDLVVLTGHAFQVFLSRVEQIAVLSTIAEHLEPNGRFIFDTRNPDFPGRKERNREETLLRLEHPEYGPIEKWNESRFDQATGILTYSNTYRILETGEVRTGVDRIRYTPKSELADLLSEAGLDADEWLGGWTGEPFDQLSREIIPLGRQMT